MTNSILNTIQLILVSLISLVMAKSTDTDCWITNWNELYRVMIPKTSVLYSQSFKAKQIINSGDTTYWQYHYFSLCQPIDTGVGSQVNYYTEVFEIGKGFISSSSATKDNFFQNIYYYYQEPVKDSTTGLAMKFVIPDPTQIDAVYLDWDEQDLHHVFDQGLNQHRKNNDKDDPPLPNFYMDFSDYNKSTITNATFVIDAALEKQYLYFSSKRFRSFSYVVSGAILLITCLIVREKLIAGHKIDFSVAVATGFLSGWVINVLAQYYWMSSISSWLISIIPIPLGLIFGILFVKDFARFGSLIKIILGLISFVNCLLYLSYETPTFMWTYTVLFFLFACIVMVTVFKNDKIEWMVSCAYSIQGWRLICSSIHPNTLYGSFKTLNVDKIFVDDNL
jgi:hypothetical protein